MKTFLLLPIALLMISGTSPSENQAHFLGKSHIVDTLHLGCYYQLSEQDSQLYQKLNQLTKQEYDKISPVFRKNGITLFQYGTLWQLHYRAVYVLLSVKGSMVFFPDPNDGKAPKAFVNNLFKHGLIDSSALSTLQSYIDQSVRCSTRLSADDF